MTAIDGSGPESPAPPSGSSRYPGQTLRVAGEYAWRLIVVGIVLYFAVKLLRQLSLAVIPLVVSLLVTALLRPISDFFRRRGVLRPRPGHPRHLAGGGRPGWRHCHRGGHSGCRASPQAWGRDQQPAPSVQALADHRSVATEPDHCRQPLENDHQWVSKNSSAIASTALSTGKTAVKVLGGLALTLFSTILLLYDGDRIWAFLLKGAPVSARPRADAAGRAFWRTIGHYVRGTLFVAFFHGVVMVITLTVLGVPLAFPLAVLIGLGSFVPLVGAFVTGVLAVAVAGLSKGLVAAIVVVAVLLLDNQIEAHVLQPLVVGRYVRIHPLAVVLALTSGALLFGIFGAIVAVPLVAGVNSAVRAARDQPPEGGVIPSPDG